MSSPVDVPADGGAARAQFLDGVLELLRRQIGKLQRDRGQRNVAVRMRLAPFRQLFIVKLDDLGGQVAIRAA